MDAGALTILLVEDNPADARLLTLLLAEAAGAACRVELAGSLKTALARLAAGGVDLVMLDLGLPDSWGLDGFHAIQSQAPQVPVIVLTGMDDHDLALSAVQAGAQVYLVKGQLDGDRIWRSARYSIERKG